MFLGIQWIRIERSLYLMNSIDTLIEIDRDSLIEIDQNEDGKSRIHFTIQLDSWLPGTKNVCTHI